VTPADVLKLIQEKDAKFADLRFTDTIGKEQHVTIPARLVDEGLFADGKMFDGSSIAGWKGINESDMILMPDAQTAVIDPFYEETTVNLRCDVIEPATMQGYGRDPRSLAKRAEADWAYSISINQRQRCSTVDRRADCIGSIPGCSSGQPTAYVTN